MECSAKDGRNVDRVFRELLVQAKVPDLLSQVVIENHKKRRKSLPNIHNQDASKVAKDLPPNSTTSDSSPNDDSQCSIV